MLRRWFLAVAAFALLPLSLGAATHTVNVGPGMQFAPANLTVAVGDTVTWNFLEPNHTTTSEATIGPDAWNSGVVPSGGTFSHTFANLGDHPYYCAVHSFPGGTLMNGVVTVAAPLTPVVTSVDPSSGDPAGGLTVTVSGANFVADCSVLFGAVPSPSTTFVNAATLAAVTPAQPAGVVDVTVTCSTGSFTLPDAFEYEAAAAGAAIPATSRTMSIVLALALVAVAFVTMRNGS